MSAVKFNHVFVGLLALATMSAFVIPQKYTDKVRNVQGLFAPVASPTRKLAAAVNQRISKPDDCDHRVMADVRAENMELRTTLMGLTGQLDELKRINAERSKLGNLRQLCTPAAVMGSDTGTNESLSLGTASGLTKGMPVVYTGGLVGRISRGNGSGAQVMLVADRSFRAMGKFVFLQKDAAGTVTSQTRGTRSAVAEGDGKGGLIVRSYWKEDADKIVVGDELVLEDAEWPISVQGQRLGQVVDKSESRSTPLFFEIKLKPLRNLKELSEVMVVTKG